MNAFVAYSLPIQGLKTGIHHYTFQVDSAFFAGFEGSPVQEGNMQIALELDKRPDMMLLDFALEGSVKTECDRCTAIINLPLQAERQLIVKFGDGEGEAEDEVVYLHRDAPEFNVAKYLYEFIVLAMPITHTYNCENDPVPPCNFEVLRHLKSEEKEEDSPGIWDSLRQLKNDN